MNLNQIDVAVAEAKRFLRTVEKLKKAKIESHERYKKYSQHSTVANAFCPKEQGSVRRASLDLTRALAEMRRPG